MFKEGDMVRVVDTVAAAAYGIWKPVAFTGSPMKVKEVESRGLRLDGGGGYIWPAKALELVESEPQPIGTTTPTNIDRRERIATAAMAAILTDQQLHPDRMTSRGDVAACAVECADALIAELERKG